MKKKTEKRLKGSNHISTIAPAILGIVVAVFIVSFGTQLTAQVGSSQCSGTVGIYNYSKNVCCTLVDGSLCNATDNTNQATLNQTSLGVNALAQWGNWWSILVLAIIFGVIIGVIGMYFGGFFGGSRRF